MKSILSILYLIITGLLFRAEADFLPIRENFNHLHSDMSIAEINLPNEKQIDIFCTKQQGVLTQKWNCPLSGAIRLDGPFCVLSDRKGRTQVTNGCTGTYGFGPQFFKACVLHDFCYHNHGLLNGKTKTGCDNKFLIDMYDMCDRSVDKTATYSRFGCYLMAQEVFYSVVQYFGYSSWNCSNELVEYPQSVEDI